MRLPAWLRQPSDHRAEQRVSDPGIVAFFWSGGIPHPNPVRHIGYDGAFIETQGKWYVGAILALTLQEQRPEVSTPIRTGFRTAALPRSASKLAQPSYLDRLRSVLTSATLLPPQPVVEDFADTKPSSLHVTCMVSRNAPDGIGVQFASDPGGRGKLAEFVATCVRNRKARDLEQDTQTAAAALVEAEAGLPMRDAAQQVQPDQTDSEPAAHEEIGADLNHADLNQPGLKSEAAESDRNLRLIKKKTAQAGESLVEFALLLPMLMFLVINVVNWGTYIYAWIAVTSASRTAAEYAVLDGAAAGNPTAATATQITNIVKADIASLLNGAAPTTLNVCQNYNGTITTVLGTCTGVPADPIAASYVLTTVDVVYTYNPPIPLFKFPGTGINLTLASKTIKRRTQMRRLQ